MYPILFRIGDFTLRSYGLMVALGFLAAIWMVSREAERVGENKEKIVDLAFYMVLAAVVGARLLYVLLEWQYFSTNPLDAFKIWKGGLVFYGGFLGALAAGALYVRKESMPFWKTADIFALVIPLGHAVGRIGCLLAGCCYGAATNLPWAVEYTHPESLAPLHVHLHPTQVYSSVNNLAIFGILLLLRKRKHFEGQLALTYVFLYSITRGIIEIWRGDDRGILFYGVISPAQLIGVVLAFASIAGMVFLYRRSKSF